MSNVLAHVRSRSNRIKRSYAVTLIICVTVTIVNIPLLLKPYLTMAPFWLSMVYMAWCLLLLAIRNTDIGRENIIPRIAFLTGTHIYIFIRAAMGGTGETACLYLIPAITIGFIILSDQLIWAISTTLLALGLLISAEVFMVGGWSVVNPPSEKHLLAARLANIVGSTSVFTFLSILAYRLLGKSEEDLATEKAKLDSLLAEMKSDLVLAQKMQAALIQNVPIDFQKVKIDAWSKPISAIGGDFYRCFQLPDGEIRILFGDAMGHGVQAALVTIAIGDEFEAIAEFEIGPAELLSRLNKKFCARFGELTTYATCILLQIKLASNELVYASAGHLTQYQLRLGKIMSLENTGIPIGISNDSQYAEKVIDFNAESDSVLLFTDGLLGGGHTKDQMYLEPELIRNLKKWLASSPNDLHAYSQKIFRDFTQSENTDDDAMLLCISQAGCQNAGVT